MLRNICESENSTRKDSGKDSYEPPRFLVNRFGAIHSSFRKKMIVRQDGANVLDMLKVSTMGIIKIKIIFRRLTFKRVT